MRHVPFFRWVLTIGVILLGCSAGVHMTLPDYPKLRQVDLTVLDEASDGRCTVRWTDPFDHREHEGPYRCDTERDPGLRDSGYVIAEGSDQGELYSLEGFNGTAEGRIKASDTLAVVGLLLSSVGLVGGNIRGMARLGGVRPRTVRRAERLGRAAALVAQDHARAVEAVREAWAPLQRERVAEKLRTLPVARLRGRIGGRPRARELERAGIRSVQEVLESGTWELGQLPGVGRETAEKAVAAARGIAESAHGCVTVRLDASRPSPATTALVAALHVLVAAGPGAQKAAQTGRALDARLEPLLDDAEAASGYRRMLTAGPERRRRARTAVTELLLVLKWAEQGGLEQRFGQVSVDLLRGTDSGPAGLDAWVDYEARPAEYHRLLTEITGTEPAAPPRPRRPAVLRRRSPARELGSV
ncbi:hypothetical protein [Streptomyces sp. NBC_01012]|uniref:hypothetical protein n=1 Tax=Streptomyces sp. NBC_01012 TaxID=2903717 RepID=UPI00386957A8|nr:helix-hairpin-helix domain-containing protein [Streptomyces sp. NBC_01012]